MNTKNNIHSKSQNSKETPPKNTENSENNRQTWKQSILSKFPGVMSANSGKENYAPCPAHADNGTSLKITFTENKAEIQCQAGCIKNHILNAVGLHKVNLILSPNGNKSRRIVATYDYHDENGQVLFQTVRYDPKDFAQRHRGDKGQWIWNLQGVRRVPYNLPEVLNAQQVLIVEGEKDVETARKLGITATTAPLGAGKWKDEYNPHFKGKDVSIIRDNDSEGKRDVEEKARSLQPVVKSLKLITLPGVGEKGDLTDWVNLDQHHNLSALQTLIENTPLYSQEQEIQEPSIKESYRMPGNGDRTGLVKAVIETLQEKGSGVFDCYSDFLKIAFACKAEGLDYATLDSILCHSDNYNSEQNRRIYEKLPRPGSITFGTAYDYAYRIDADTLREKLRRYSDNEHKPHGNKPPQQEQTPTEWEIKSQKRKEQIFSTVQDITFDISQQHRILQEYYQQASMFTDAKPQTIITPFLSALAVNIGNKALIQVGARPHFCNVWSIVIAPSTIGRKTTCIELAMKPIRDYDLELDEESVDRPHFTLPTATSERFTVILKYNPNGIMIYSEIAAMLSQLNKSYNNDLKAKMTAMFDSYVPVKHETMTRSDTIERPCFSIAAATTKEWFLKELDKDSDIGSGFMQRFIVCNSHDVEIDNLNFAWIDGKDDCTRFHNWLATLYNELRQQGTIEHPLEIAMSEDAKQIYEETNRHIFNELYNQEESDLYSYAGRCFTDYFIRFSIIFTLIDYIDGVHQELVVTKDTALYAMRLCHFYFQNITSFLKNEIAETLEKRHEKMIMKVLKKYPGEPIKRSDLKNLSNLNKKDFDLAITNLIECEVIEQMVGKKAKNGKTPTLYVYKG